MQTHLIKSTIFSAVVLFFVGIISGCFGYVYTVQNKKQDSSVSTVPHIYYSVKTITALDAQGNSTGNTSVFRVDGMNGQSVKVLDLPKGMTGPTWSPSTIQYDVWSKGDSEQSTFHVSTDVSGNEVWGTYNYKTAPGNSAGDIKTNLQWVHPDGMYVTQSQILCSNSPKDMLCDESFRFIVTDLQTNSKKTYNASTFGIADGQLIVRVLSNLSPTTVVLQIAALQDPGNAFIGVFDLSTGIVVRTLYREDGAPTFQNKSYEFLRLSDDRQFVYFLQWYVNDTTDKQLVSMNVQTGEVHVVLPPTNFIDYVWPRGSTYLYYKKTDSTIIQRNMQTEVERAIVWRNTIDSYLHPQRFTAKLRTSTSGIDSGKLTVIDTETGQERVIYDQARNENAYGGNGNVNGSTDDKNAREGDQVFTFLGIEQ